MLKILAVANTSKIYEINKFVEYYSDAELAILANTGDEGTGDADVDILFAESILDKNLNFNFSQQGDVLQFTCKENNIVKYKFNLSLETIKSSELFADQTYWAIKSIPLQTKCKDDQNVYNLTANDIVELCNTTLKTKTSNFNFPKESRDFNDIQNTISTPFRIFVPSYNSSLSDCKIIVNKPIADLETRSTVLTITGDVNITYPNPEITTNAQIQQIINSTGKPHWDWRPVLISDITLSSTQQSYTAGDNITVNVATEDPTISTVYIEASVGVIAKQVVTLTNGIGSFIIRTEGLETGDIVKVKAGYKYFTGVTVFTKTLA